MFRLSFILIFLLKQLSSNGAVPLPRGKYATVLSADYVLLQGNLNFSKVTYTLEKVESAVKLFETELEIKGNRGGLSQSYLKLITAVYASVTERLRRISNDAWKLPFGEHFSPKVRRSVAAVAATSSGKRLVALGVEKLGHKIGSSVIQKLITSTDNGAPPWRYLVTFKPGFMAQWAQKIGEH